MKKIGIIGDFSYGHEAIGGQTIKTRLISNELTNLYGKQDVICTDTRNWKKNPFNLFFDCLKVSIICKNIIILPAHNGIKVFIPLFVIFNFFFRRKLHYIVVGAWIADELKKNRLLLKFTKSIDYIYVQTSTLKKKLKDIGVEKNTHIMPNFKSINPLPEKELFVQNKLPFNFCILSRVEFKKGIEDAIEVVKKLNQKNSKIIATLDIYGPIQETYKNMFLEILREHSSFVSYKGSINHDKTVEVLKNYFLLLFPTKYYTEGIPGTILDAYLSGVPVLASRWESWSDVIEEGITGFTYEFGNKDDFLNKLEVLTLNNSLVNESKRYCLLESNRYKSENVMQILIEKLK